MSIRNNKKPEEMLRLARTLGPEGLPVEDSPSVKGGPNDMKPSEDLERFRCNDSLVHRKLLSYLPFMIATNLSTFLLSTADGLVVGNLVGKDALSAVSIFMPIAIVISIVCSWVSSGISTALSTSMGDNRVEDIAPLKKAARVVAIISAVIVCAIEFPVAAVLIDSYNLSAGMHTMVWQYGAGVLISLPFGLISTVCTYNIMILGLTKILTVLAITEACINLGLDLLFVGVLHMGIAGAGYGTAAANMVRCALSVIYLYRKTDIFRCGGAKLRRKDIVTIFRLGSVDASFTAMMALQGVIMLKFILAGFGESGGTINGVCRFCMSIANIAIMSIQASARPLAGIFSGAGETISLRMLIRRSLLLNLCIVGLITLFILLFPALFYHINGVQEIPAFGILCLRLFVTQFVFRGFSSIFRLYFADRGESRFASFVTVITYVTLPVFAYLLSRHYAPLFWLAYLLSEFTLFIVNAVHYLICVNRDMQKELPEEAILYLTVSPEDAIEASQCVRRYAERYGFPERLAYRAALCMEEMIYYSVSAGGSHKVRNELTIKFFPDSCVFSIFDDGRCIMLDEDEGTKELITNYNVIRKIAASFKYQYTLNLNHTVFLFK